MTLQCPHLSQNTVHLWTVVLDATEYSVNKLRQLLAEDELAKSDRFHFEGDREHYIICRAVLRQLIGQYVNIPPEQVVFSYGTYGKPYLCETTTDLHDLRFNVSHSKGLAVMAFAKGQDIGVDVEQIHQNLDIVSIAQRFFSAYEVVQLQMLPLDLQQEAFFACWTRKEAFLKARGDGLSFPLEDFDVSVDPREAPKLLATQLAPEEVSRWYMYQMIPNFNYISTLAVEGYVKEVISYKALNGFQGSGTGRVLRGL